MKTQPTVLNTVAIAVARCLAAHGCDAERLFLEAGFDPAVLTDPAGRHAVGPMKRLWELAIAQTGDPCLGLKAAAFLQPAAFHGLGLALLASENLLEALQRSARYSRLVSDVADVEIRETAEGFMEVFRFRPDIPVAPESIDMFIANTVSFGRMLTGVAATPLRVTMRRSPPPNAAAAFEAHFGCPVHFQADEDSLLVDRTLALRPLPMANPMLAGSNDRIAVDYLARLDEARFSERVRSVVIARLPSGEPSRSLVARMLKVGDKTLQRRLEAEGTSYRALLDETRRDLAREYLSDDGCPLADVAARLGFADQSAFTKACKRWMGCSPGEYREQCRRSKG